MSILGNDFLPSSLGMKMRYNGHATLLAYLERGANLIDPESYEISWEHVQRMFESLSRQEERSITTFIQNKIQQAITMRQSDEPYRTVGDHHWPLSHIPETVLLDVEETGLMDGWEKRYETMSHGSQHAMCATYMTGIQWIWAYYTGRTKDVCYEWYYPFSLPPLWKWLAKEKEPSRLTVRLFAEDIRPVEQLALVLPLSSWSLLPPCPERAFPQIAPQFFPERFGFESVGKRFFWECEAKIPIPSMMELKALVRMIKR